MNDDEIKAALDRLGITAIAGYDQSLAKCIGMMDRATVFEIGNVMTHFQKARDNGTDARLAAMGEFAMLGYFAAFKAWRER